jgi:leucyl aminopeptidase
MGKLPKDEEDGTSGDRVGFALGKAIAAKVNAEKKIATCAVILPKVLSDASTLTDISSSMYASLYSDNRYRTGDKIKKVAEDLTSVTLVATTMGDEGGDKSVLLSDVTADEALETGRKVAAGIFLTKDIVNSPHNVLNSLSLADTAKRIAAESGGRLKCTILDKKECEKRGMGAYLGVARGSETEPQFIHLTYTPKVSKENKKVGIVGKGLLFDTGGYNIKTSMMELMKFDCGGSAAVLGAARTIAALAPEGVEAHFIVAACENMINERSMVPSDILTASNGKTIEIGNTDAEGRLTLADALVFADKEIGCESIIELSTLTGACMISLGKSIAGVWTSNDALAKELEEISKVTGDKSWRMPLESSYNEQLESKIADLNNVGTRYGGAITAALFLQNFVQKKKPFAHIDIAGPVWNDKTGATGYGTRMVTEWVKRQGEAKGE